ncbi:MAG: Gfo/Idh/MocA family oxidoreductase, partial [Deinococcus-Thermus bacterium]|nr:Gfo/Idh/MocA family oxidoreductase [Deinococcota bacterium]
MTAPLRVGILSTANIARAAVVPALRACDDTEVVAVASRDAERARSFASELEIPRAHGSYEALLDDGGVDAVYVALPNALHEEWTIQALEAGKHVLCEKPLAPTVEACRRMGEAAGRAERVLMEAFMYRFHPRTRHAEALVREGRIGRLAHVDATFTFRVRDPSNIRLSRELAGGALLDVGCYTVDVARRLVGRPIETVSATSRFDGADGVDLDRAFLPGDGPVAIELAEAGGVAEDVEVPGKDPYLAMVETFATRALGGAADDMPASDAAEALST